jgi:hypothetical protein
MSPRDGIAKRSDTGIVHCAKGRVRRKEAVPPCVAPTDNRVYHKITASARRSRAATRLQHRVFLSGATPGRCRHARHYCDNPSHSCLPRRAGHRWNLLDHTGTTLTRLDPIHCYARHSLPVPNQTQGKYVAETTYAETKEPMAPKRLLLNQMGARALMRFCWRSRNGASSDHELWPGKRRHLAQYSRRASGGGRQFTHLPSASSQLLFSAHHGLTSMPLGARSPGPP